MYDIIIIGAGVIGSAIARELSRYKLKIVVLEKENDICEVTSMANSGIIHSGYDPKPNTLKAKLNIIGNSLMDKLSRELGFDFKRIGSLTVTSEEKLDILEELQFQGKKNGVETFILKGEEIFKLEPNLNKEIKYALFAPSCGIVNPFEYTISLMENAIANGTSLKLNEEVIAIARVDNFYEIRTTKNKYQGKIIINAAGLNSAKIANMIGKKIEIKPRKGEYFVLDHFDDNFIKHTIFPLPSAKGKGILITPTTHNNYLVGPSSEYIDHFDDFSTDTITLNNIKESIKNICDIPYKEVIRTFAGLRSTISSGDFIIEEDEKNHNFYHLLGIDSPGLASSYGIALYLVDLIKKNNHLELNSNFNPCRNPYLKLNNMSLEEKNVLFKEDKDYGKIICRCENISLGEIKDVLKREPKPKTIRAIKKRIRPGFGKCQGGFCESLVYQILAQEYNEDICYSTAKSKIVKEVLNDENI